MFTFVFIRPLNILAFFSSFLISQAFRLLSALLYTSNDARVLQRVQWNKITHTPSPIHIVQILGVILINFMIHINYF
jgi:hypothetical protein